MTIRNKDESKVCPLFAVKLNDIQKPIPMLEHGHESLIICKYQVIWRFEKGRAGLIIDEFCTGFFQQLGTWLFFLIGGYGRPELGLFSTSVSNLNLRYNCLAVLATVFAPVMLKISQATIEAFGPFFR